MHILINFNLLPTNLQWSRYEEININSCRQQYNIKIMNYLLINAYTYTKNKNITSMQIKTFQ